MKVAFICLFVQPIFGQCYTDSNGNTVCRINCAPSRIETTKIPAKTPAELNDLLRQIKENPFLLKQALKHPAMEYRVVGIYAIAINKMPRQYDLIELLKDRDPQVQWAARQALIGLTIKYGKKEDFGPLHGATKEQVGESIQEWTNWWDQRKELVQEKLVQQKK